MLALLVGGQAAVAIRTPRHERQALFAICLCLAVGTHMYGDWIYRPTACWIKQVVALIQMTALSWDVVVADLFRCPPQNIHVPSMES